VPSASSFAETKPDMCGSRVGGDGRVGRATAGGVVTWVAAGFTPAIKFNIAPRNPAPQIILVIFIVFFRVAQGRWPKRIQPKLPGAIKIPFQFTTVKPPLLPCVTATRW
jgi:hypothetical protein